MAHAIPIAQRAPIVGAMTGAAVKIMVMIDMSLAAALPLAMSRTMARDMTSAGAEPIPWMNLPASITSIESAMAAAMAPARNRAMPAYRTGNLPIRSETSPAGICPNAIPNMKMPTIC